MVIGVLTLTGMLSVVGMTSRYTTRNFSVGTKRHSYTTSHTMNKYIKVLLYGSNIWYFGEGMLGPLLAVFTETIGGDILDISWAWATYLITTGIFYIIVGKYTDQRNNKEQILVLGYTMNAILTFGYLLVSAPWHLFMLQIGLGIAAACATPTWDALYAKHEDKKHDGYQWGIAGGEANIITGIAIIIGGLLIKYFSFTTLFVVMGIIQIIATAYQAKILAYKK
jgi:MFS family permease